MLLAYAAANIIALVPLTPGGLGLVEASLGGLLILAGVHGGDAYLATLAYRLASYWLPLSAGPSAYLLFRHRYSRAVPPRPLEVRHDGWRIGAEEHAACPAVESGPAGWRAARNAHDPIRSQELASFAAAGAPDPGRRRHRAGHPAGE